MSDHCQIEFKGITPYLHYDNIVAMIEWLARVFGFTEKGRWLDAQGAVRNAELATVVSGVDYGYGKKAAFSALSRTIYLIRRCLMPRVTFEYAANLQEGFARCVPQRARGSP